MYFLLTSDAFEQQFVCDESDKFAVGGLFVLRIDSYAEKGIDVLDFAPIPTHLDGVAYGTLHLGGAGVELGGYTGIELFCDAVDYVGVFY